MYSFQLVNRSLFGAVCISLLTPLALIAAEPVTSPQPRPTTESATTSTPTLTAQSFAQKAAVAGQKEVCLSEIALKKASDDNVKDYAKMMINDHSKANQKLAGLAKDKNLKIPPQNAFSAAVGKPGAAAQPGARPSDSPTSPPRTGAERGTATTPGTESLPQEDLQAAQRLQGLSGEAFDAAYVEEMKKDHAKTIELFQQAAEKLDDSELQQFAQQTLPTLEKHREHLEQVAAEVKEDK